MFEVDNLICGRNVSASACCFVHFQVALAARVSVAIQARPVASCMHILQHKCVTNMRGLCTPTSASVPLPPTYPPRNVQIMCSDAAMPQVAERVGVDKQILTPVSN